MAAKKTPPDTSATTFKKRLTLVERAERAEASALRAEARLQRLGSQNPMSNQVRGFVDFLREQSVVGLAIGLVLGTQAKQLVDQMVLSFFNPVTGLLLPGEGTLKQKTFTVDWGGKSEVFAWGAFMSSTLTFVLVAAVVYYVFRGLRLDKLDKKKDEEKK
ncbi:MAG: MscL family protein [Patescibacteria group bacterium]